MNDSNQHEYCTEWNQLGNETDKRLQNHMKILKEILGCLGWCDVTGKGRSKSSFNLIHSLMFSTFGYSLGCPRGRDRDE